MSLTRRAVIGLVLVCSACSGFVSSLGDAGLDAGSANDAGVTLDAGMTAGDAGLTDAGLTDAGALDAGLTDAGVDAGAVDAGALDAGEVDAGPRDAGFDAGMQPDAAITMCGTFDAGGFGDGGTTYAIDFALAPLENPLSAGCVWTNNSQGTGGNQPPGNFTSMVIGLASDGVTHIAHDTHGGIDYDDSFAFVPGFSGDQFIEAVVYKEAGYDANAAGANHEIELLLGCSSGPGVRTWNEFLINSGGGVDILYLSGSPSDFQSISNVSGTGRSLIDGDVIRATRVGDVLSLYLNGTLWLRYDGSDPSKVARGSGIGIAGFIRPGAVHNKFGFRRLRMGTL